MNDPRTVFKTLSELYQFHKKLAKTYSIPHPKSPRMAETAAAPIKSKPSSPSRRGKSV
jgi:hypothetical protein